jgi:hypothetical protein
MKDLELKDQNEAEAVPVQRENIHNYSDEEKRAAHREAAQDDYDPTQAVKVAQNGNNLTPEKTLKDYEIEALFMLGMSEAAIKQMVNGELSFDEALTLKTAQALAPVLQKYGGELPPWLAPYLTEIKAGYYLSCLGFGVFMQYKMIKKHEAEEARKAKREAEEKQRAAYQS